MSGEAYLRSQGLKFTLKSRISHRRTTGDHLGGGKTGGLCVEGLFVRSLGSTAVAGILALT